MGKSIAIFLDRDGTINEEVGYIENLNKFRIIPAAFEAIRLINLSGLQAVVITNQAAIAKGLITEAFVGQTHELLQTELKQKGAAINAFYYCPHHPTEGSSAYRRICDCRKPAPGLLLQAAREMNIDLSSSYMIGDRYRDMEAAHRAGVKGVLVKTGYGADVLANAGPDEETPAGKPEFIAEDILEAVRWILRSRQ
ncbi:MAG: D,D-heptose 1,7-bisphosphate phosphatase [Deltaproteobacteria bacterium HGW-Deltaproteobacteria-6]|jgi:D,D-heptose 1,7-bisphosphate phosphatase|nr:MAG: D,D-heptose 1,7-bisphosphate phosphatase [Deltaproteobacteria bacterium HGW-Deltaproteobacteria-6]